MKYSKLAAVLAVASGMCVVPQDAYGAEITSPSGTVKLKADVVDSVPVYSIEYKNKKVVLPSKLGFELADGPDMMDGFRLIDTSVSSFDEVWQPVWGENSHIRNNYNEIGRAHV